MAERARSPKLEQTLARSLLPVVQRGFEKNRTNARSESGKRPSLTLENLESGQPGAPAETYRHEERGEMLLLIGSAEAPR